MKKEKVFSLLKNKKLLLGLTILIFLAILISSTNMRLGNLPALVDRTTGKYDLADPDAYYMYRVAETYLKNNGDLSGIDTMRGPGLNLSYNHEILSPVLVYSYKFLKMFSSDITLNVVDTYYPAIAFSVSLIIFFFFVWYLSKSKLASLLACALLAYFPSYLNRTMAGVSSHESLGMVFMFLTFLTFLFSLDKLQGNWKKTIVGGILVGVTLALSFVSWGGGSNFALMTFPLATLFYYLFKISGGELNAKKRFVMFTLIWAVIAGLIPFMVGYSFNSFYNRLFTPYGLLIPFVILFMVSDLILERFSSKIKIGGSIYRRLYSFLGAIILGFAGLLIVGKNPLSLIGSMYSQLLHPFGTERVGLTVAYYAQPYTSDLIAQYTPLIFWMAFLGMIFIGFDASKRIESIKSRIYFTAIWIIAISGMIFSRMSASSLLNGRNFISQTIYFLSFLILGIYLLRLYVKNHFKISAVNAFLFAWTIVMILSMRSAVRVIFVISVFIVVALVLFILKCYENAKSSDNKMMRNILYIVSIISLLLIIVFLFGNPITGATGRYTITKESAKSMGPITNEGWQYAMQWVRNNTGKEDIFIHWWDYGYQIQTLGERTTVLDGGNANAYWDHLMGRYVLTTPNPETAYSMMKAHNVSYLLIDPTDIGKYSAFSKIGSDENAVDRFSAITTMVLDPAQTVESGNATVLVYTGGGMTIDDDINYNNGNQNVFLPSGKAGIVGIIWKRDSYSGGISQFEPPLGVYYYKNQRYDIPIRYVYFKGEMKDYGSGYDAVLRVIPSFDGSNINEVGSMIYLSPKVASGLFAQLYILDDVSGKYRDIKLAHVEQDYVVNVLRAQGAPIGEFIFFQGLRAPLKIWKVDYPSNIIGRSEFLETEGSFGGLDNLDFTK